MAKTRIKNQDVSRTTKAKYTRCTVPLRSPLSSSPQPPCPRPHHPSSSPALPCPIFSALKAEQEQGSSRPIQCRVPPPVPAPCAMGRLDGHGRARASCVRSRRQPQPAARQSASLESAANSNSQQSTDYSEPLLSRRSAGKAAVISWRMWAPFFLTRACSSAASAPGCERTTAPYTPSAADMKAV